MSANFNNADLTKAIYNMLKLDPALNAKKFIIVRSELINTDHENVPWIGVYKGSVDYEPYILGAGSAIRNYKVLAEPQIIVQAFSGESGEEAEDLLEEYIGLVYDVIQSDKTLRAMVAHVVGYEIDYDYSSRDDGEGNIVDDFFFQQATITVKVEVRK